MLLDEIRKIPSTKKELRSFGLLVGGVFLVIAGIGYWRQHGWIGQAWPYFAGIGGFLFVLGAVLPQLLLPFQKAWMALALVLGSVMMRVLMSLLYYLVMTPIGLILRLRGRDLLGLKRDASRATYWSAHESKSTPEDQY